MSPAIVNNITHRIRFLNHVQLEGFETDTYTCRVNSRKMNAIFSDDRHHAIT